MKRPRASRLRPPVLFSLFATSYAPLFVIMAANQISRNRAYLTAGPFNTEGVTSYFRHFLLSTVLIAVTTIGFFGLALTLRELKRTVLTTGHQVVVEDVQNKNSEAISYISTYILPFLFQDYDSIFQTFVIFSILFIIYTIYIKSNLILINPALSIRYTLYEINFTEANTAIPASQHKRKSGLIILQDNNLDEGDEVFVKKIGNKLFFGESIHE